MVQHDIFDAAVVTLIERYVNQQLIVCVRLKV